MHLGIQIPNLTWPGGDQQLGPTFGRIVENAERAGLYSLWTMDHVLQPHLVGPIDGPVVEGWSALNFAAARSSRIKLGVLVTAVNFRHPGLLVKTATTLDVLSEGRSYFGIGAAWFDEENPAYGLPYPPTKVRFEHLEETLQIALQMWAGDERPYEGKHFQLTRPINSPQSLQRPHPPILIAGAGERKTLRLVAQYGDACNLFSSIGKDELKRKLALLQEHCETVGRPYEQIEKTVTSNDIQFTRDGRNGTFSPSAAIDHFGELAELGFDHGIFSLPNPYESEPFELLASEIVPAVEKIRVAGR